MTNRDTGYFEKNVKNQQTSNNASRNIARNKIHTARSKSSRWGIVYSVNYVLFCLLTLYFIISKVLFGGFYSTISHTAAVVILGAAVALLFVSVILTFIVRWLRGRLYIVHLINCFCFMCMYI